MPISRYSMENDNINPINAKLLYVTHSVYENDWPSLPHTHYFTELCYIKRGKGNYLIEDQIYPVKEDDFIIINSNITHTERSVGDIPLEYIILGVEGLNFSFEGDHEHIIFSCRNDHDKFMYHMNGLLTEMEEKKPNYELVCQDMLEILIVNLIRRAHFDFESVSSVKSSRECIKLKQYIEMNYPQDITLDTLAEVSHLNKYYMVHSFTKYAGLSPIQYLNQTRLKRAQHLLKNTNYSISDIASSTGFSSQSYFTQIFRKNFNMTPVKYRQEHAKN